MERRPRVTRALLASIFVLVFTILVCSTATVYASCNHNGQVYPPGARVGPSLCMPNGSWQPPIQQPPGQQPPRPQVQQPPGQQPPRPPGQQPQVQQAPGQQPQPQVQQLQQKTLTPTEARQRIQDLNQNRTAMQGINRNLLPSGQVTVHPDGKHTIAASGDRHIDVRPNGTVEKVALRDGRTATFRPDGKIISAYTSGMQIHHSLHGERHIVTERPDKSVLVSTGLRRGYLQRPIVTHNRLDTVGQPPSKF